MDSVVGIDEAVETDGLSFVGIVGFEAGQPGTFGRTLDDQLLRSGAHGGGDDFLLISTRGLQFLDHLELRDTIQEIADDLFYRKPLPGKEAIWDAKYLHHNYPG